MATQHTELLRQALLHMNYLGTDTEGEEEQQTYLGTMQAFETIELDEEEVLLAREAAKQRVNRTEVRPNLFAYDWTDAHGALWDKVKKRLTPMLDTWGATLDKVDTKAVSVAGGGGIRALPGTISLAIPMHVDEVEVEILIETPNPTTKVHRRIWRHDFGYSLLQPETAIGTQTQEIYLLLANIRLEDK